MSDEGREPDPRPGYEQALRAVSALLEQLPGPAMLIGGLAVIVSVMFVRPLTST